MKQIIESRIYNPEKAEKIASWTNGRYPDDFAWESETLYRTSKGNWFVHACGGAMSSQARRTGNERYGGESLMALGADEVVQWMTERNQVAALLQYFPHSVENA